MGHDRERAWALQTPAEHRAAGRAQESAGAGRGTVRTQTGAKFSRQMPVGPFFADFLCRELALVVELDGFSHDCTPERDARRDAWMAAHGFTVLRFTNADVRDNVEGVVTAIRLEVERLRRLKGRAHP